MEINLPHKGVLLIRPSLSLVDYYEVFIVVYMFMWLKITTPELYIRINLPVGRLCECLLEREIERERDPGGWVGSPSIEALLSCINFGLKKCDTESKLVQAVHMS